MLRNPPAPIVALGQKQNLSTPVGETAAGVSEVKPEGWVFSCAFVLVFKKLEVSAPLARQPELELRSWAVSWALPRLGAVRLSLRKPPDLWMAQKIHTANTAGAPEEQRYSLL